MKNNNLNCNSKLIGDSIPIKKINLHKIISTLHVLKKILNFKIIIIMITQTHYSHIISSKNWNESTVKKKMKITSLITRILN